MAHKLANIGKNRYIFEMRCVVLAVVVCACGGQRNPSVDGDLGDMAEGPFGASNMNGDGGGNGEDGEHHALNYGVGGNVTGLTAIGLVLRNVNGETLSIQGNGPFHFATRLADLATYDLTIDAQPPGQLCTMTNGTGTIMAADVTAAEVACVLAYSIGGNINGLTTGQSVTLTNNSGNTTTFTANGAFTFSVAVLPGGSYNVDVTDVSGEVSCNVFADAGPVAAAVTSVQVFCLQPVQPASPLFANWGRYFKRSGVGACTGEEIGHFDRCVHGAERRVVVIRGLKTCLRKGADALQAFDWECENEVGTNDARYFSTGLQAGKHLSDLIDANTGTWKKNSFHVQNDAMQVLQTPESDWWTNPITLDYNLGVIAATGHVFVFRSDYPATITVSSDETSIVAVPGVTLDTVSIDARRFTWIEGSINALGLDNGGSFNRIDNVVAHAVGISSKSSLARDLSVTVCTAGCISLSDATGTTLENVYASSDGISIASSNNVVLRNVHVDSAATAISIDHAFGTVLQQIYVSAAGTAGVRLADADHTTILGLTTLNCAIGLSLSVQSDDNVVMNAAFFGGIAGVENNSASTMFRDWALLGNGTTGTGTATGTVAVTGPTGNYFDAVGRAKNADTGKLRNQAQVLPFAFQHWWASAATTTAGCRAEYDQAFFDADHCYNWALVSATEVTEHTSFNDGDGLCENGEQCVRMGNIGAYQGSGPTAATGAPVITEMTPASYSRYLTTGVPE